MAGAERVRAEVPILLGVGGRLLRGSIDLLVEPEGGAPLLVDYKTDRLGSGAPAERAERYATQRSIYALASAEALGAEEVDVAYVFLERPADPALFRLGPAEMAAVRGELEAAVAGIDAAEFGPADPARRSWDLCRGCPALGRLCAGPDAG